MFTKVHHVTYVVESVQQMAEYLESSFGLKPAKSGENPDRKFILYHIGPMAKVLPPSLDLWKPTLRT